MCHGKRSAVGDAEFQANLRSTLNYEEGLVGSAELEVSSLTRVLTRFQTHSSL